MGDFSTPRDLSFSPDRDSHFRLPLPPIHSVIPAIRTTFPPIPAAPVARSPVLRNHLDTLRDVESAFHNADIALRHAREALRSDAIMSSRLGSASASNPGSSQNNGRNGSGDGSNIVDLTTLSSDTSNDDPEIQWWNPPEIQPRRGRIGLASHFAGYPIPPPGFRSGGVAHFLPAQAYHAHSHVSSHRAEENAIRRQRQARRDWERVERRNVQRAAEQAQRDAIEQARRVANQAPSGDDTTNGIASNTRARRYSSDSTTSSISLLSDDSLDSEDTTLTPHQNTQDTFSSAGTTTDTMPPTQPIDLTTLEDQPTLKDKLLSQQQQSAIEAQKSSASFSKDPKSAAPHVTPLSTYRCAICMDTPTTATTTICGHLFCHTCLKDSLKWSAQQRRDDAGLHGRRAPNAGTGLCPVCRKVLSDKEGGNKPGIVGLEIRAINRKEWEQRKKQEKDDEEREDFLRGLSQRNAESEKGKEREKESEDPVKTETQDEQVKIPVFRGLNGRVNRKRRRDGAGEFENRGGF